MLVRPTVGAVPLPVPGERVQTRLLELDTVVVHDDRDVVPARFGDRPLTGWDLNAGHRAGARWARIDRAAHRSRGPDFTCSR